MLIFLSPGCDLVMWYELNKKVKKVTKHFVVFPNTIPFGEETNMAVMGMMTCKIGLILRHMKNLYGKLKIIRLPIRFFVKDILTFLDIDIVAFGFDYLS